MTPSGDIRPGIIAALRARPTWAAALDWLVDETRASERQTTLLLIHDLRQRLYELSNDYDERDNELRFDAHIDALDGDTL